MAIIAPGFNVEPEVHLPLAVVAAEAAPEALYSATEEPLESIARRLAPGADRTPRPKLTAALKAVASDTAAP